MKQSFEVIADQVAVVLVQTSHPANIGSVARAMKTMGLTQLRLVAPDDFPSARAEWLAAGSRGPSNQAVSATEGRRRCNGVRNGVCRSLVQRSEGSERQGNAGLEVEQLSIQRNVVLSPPR